MSIEATKPVTEERVFLFQSSAQAYQDKIDLQVQYTKASGGSISCVRFPGMTLDVLGKKIDVNFGHTFRTTVREPG